MIFCKVTCAGGASLTPGRNTALPTRPGGAIVVGVTASVGVLDGSVLGVVVLAGVVEVGVEAFLDEAEHAVVPRTMTIATSTATLLRRDFIPLLRCDSDRTG